MIYTIREYDREPTGEYVALDEAMQHKLDDPYRGRIYDEDNNLLYYRVRAWVEWHEYGFNSCYRYGWQKAYQGDGSPVPSLAGRMRRVIWDADKATERVKV